MKTKLLMVFTLVLCLVGLTAQAADGLMPELQNIQHQWAKIKYQMPKDQREAAMEKLASRAHLLSRALPKRAEPLDWEAIVVASWAGEKGGLGALSLVKRARKLLLRAEKIDPSALEGSVYVTLGSLYYQVPGWPIGFGDDDKAREYLQRAVRIAPNGMASNFFMADFLMDQDRYQEAAPYLEKVVAMGDVPGRPLYSKGRKAEAAKLLHKVRKYQAGL